MKNVVFVICLVLSSVSYSQNPDVIDVRLKYNFGERITNIHENQKTYYDFLVWELNYGFEIVEINKFENTQFLKIDDIETKSGQKFNSNLLENKKQFNFLAFNFVRQKNEPVFYDLEDGRAIKFTSLTDVWVEYRKSNKK